MHRAMSMSTHVIGFVPADERWHLMRAAYDACRAAGLDIPKEVADFFGGQAPDDAGQEIEIPRHEYIGDGVAGFEVHLAELPASVKTIRFYNAW